YCNKRYGRTWSLWEGRFRSCLVQSEGYMLACYRYIELNPVRAGMVIHPGDYPWSSYCNNALGEAAARLVMPHSEYLRLGESTQERQKVYTGYLARLPTTSGLRR